MRTRGARASANTADGFPFVLALTTLHFLATFIVTALLSFGCRLFEPKFLPIGVNLIMSTVGVAAICLSNYSLEYNSVGTYQMAKLCVIPVVLLFEALDSEYASRKVLAALLVILAGVGGATVTDVEVNQTGLFFAFWAVITTAQFQIWQGSMNKQYNMNVMQMSMSVSFVQVFVAAALCTSIELHAIRTTLIESPDLDLVHLGLMVLASCALAVVANVHGFAIIGRTSAVTFQVVGHGKTCLILVAGYVMFPLPDVHALVTNVLWVSIAILGVVVYSNLKLNEPTGNEDWVSCCFTSRRATNATIDFSVTCTCPRAACGFSNRLGTRRWSPAVSLSNRTMQSLTTTTKQPRCKCLLVKRLVRANFVEPRGDGMSRARFMYVQSTNHQQKPRGWRF